MNHPGPEAPKTPAGPPPSPGGGEARSRLAVTLTPKAVEKAREALEQRGTPGAALRLGIRGGGCSGFNYHIEFDDEPPRERDHVFDFDGLRVYVDKKSMIYLAGSVLDHEKTLMYQGFKFRNPQEATSCGCGHSFTVK